jgi:pimeloyl-ACP methyl ester carboxylesterase
MARTIGDREARDLVYSLLYAMPLATQIPMVVHRAMAGDFDAFAEPPPGPGEIPRGVFLSLLCSEELARVDRSRAAEAARGSFFGEWPLRQQLAWCDVWPKGRVPESFWAPVASEAPVLVMTGTFDSTTPPRYGDMVARSLGRATTLTLPNRAHNDLDACVMGLVQAFVARGSAHGLDTSCLASTPPLRFPTTPPGRGGDRPRGGV